MKESSVEAPPRSRGGEPSEPVNDGTLLSAAAMRRVKEIEERSFNVKQQQQVRKRQQAADGAAESAASAARREGDACAPPSLRGDKRRALPHEDTPQDDEDGQSVLVAESERGEGAKDRSRLSSAVAGTGEDTTCSSSPRRAPVSSYGDSEPEAGAGCGASRRPALEENACSGEQASETPPPPTRQPRRGTKLLEADMDQAHGKKYAKDFPHAGQVQLHRRRKNDLHAWVEQLLRCQPLRREEVVLLCELLKDTLKSEPNCISVPTPVTVAGDIHGQFYDLLELFRVGGKPPNTSYLFLGDYVDRGFYSIEVFCLMAAFKVLYPRKMFLLRGNHESRGITQVYGFYDECARKYGDGFNSVWTALTDAFDYLPLTAAIGSECFCDHGGLSKHLMTVDAIQAIDRFQEPPQEGGMCDLLWSDPYDSSMFGSDGPQQAETTGGEVAVTAGDPLGGALDAEGWAPSSRGAGMLWGPNVTEQFLHLNGVGCICRAHQLAQEGYQWCHNDKVCTVFSAPNYCYRCGNQASLMIVNDDLERNFVKFGQAPERGEPQQVRSLPDYFL
ncbi:putative serine/threonine-protein phosphatase 2A catalytic subunit beta isoform [Besnoitia besnoiti]|uniref:Serine/threonine-protein phosphatase n=1 Tax=Besnoitia besnoiti TaxID=94643 RepID=A0A2A9ML40_BESBE|nr:putative serine/threonine-protein phosphatase 2A catalytic subunit beta isoform [Besnoitia besnoiti]PFH37021.1 putative serine/threonine-protein phosphatase 2A catalytic subunit beta isoform [Besnoitia besnoiti]